MPLEPEKLNDLRRRVLNNEPWTEEECSKAILEMIGDRVANITPTKAKAKSTKKTAANLDDLL
jgi:hypothetical protein